MQLVERHIFNYSNKQFKVLDDLCFLSKNLYNSSLFYLKQEYLKSGRFIRYNELEKLFKDNKQNDYMALPNNTSQQVMMLFDKNIKSYFGLLKRFKKDKTSLNGCPKFPKYKDKIKGRNIIIFTTNQARLKDGFIRFPKKSKIPPLKSKVNNLQQVRIIPQNSCYVIEVVYNVQEKDFINNENKASIDLGLNNLATITFNNSINSFIINGKPLKSINQYYNKKLAKIKSKLPLFINYKGETVQKGKSNKTIKLTNKRNNKIKDYLHKSSKRVIDILKQNKISELSIGYNPEWKNEINIGKKNNQRFVSIPFLTYIEQLKYKCQLAGINILVNEESYTSKASSLDLDTIPVYSKGNTEEYKFSGYRQFRGMYKRKGIKGVGSTINADINGSLNIGRKVFGDGFIENYRVNRGYGYYPIRVNSNKEIKVGILSQVRY